jgi:outer membrane protein OmpA-like peptidoglycan-associated protein
MRPSRSVFFAGTILSGLVAATLSPSAFAQTSADAVLAQAAPASQPEQLKKKPPAKPQPPKRPAPAVAPHPPQMAAPQALRPPAADGPRIPERAVKPAPMVHPAQVTPPPAPHAPEKTKRPEPMVHPAQVTPPPAPHAPENMKRPAPVMHPAQVTPPLAPHAPEKMKKPAPMVHPAQVTPPLAPHALEKTKKPAPMVHPAQVAPSVPGKPKPGEHPSAGNAPIGKPPAATIVRRAPPPPGNPAAVPPPTQVIHRGQFLTPKGQTPTAGINQVRAERHEEHVGNRLIIREPDRTIVQEGNRTFIRHSEVDRFAVGARNVKVERRGTETVTVVMRPNGVQIIDYTDSDGHLLRRVRRDPDGREIVIIDNGFAGAQMADEFLHLAPPVIRIPRDRYIVDADSADESAIYGVLEAPPIERIDRRYTLDQVRYNEPLRAYMPRLDLEINFDTGSWQLTPDQVDRLSFIAEALNRAIARNPREVFLIEGYTDAVGSDVDNLSLSDRRAESVAVALTEQFHVPAENLATQGYGKQFLKVPTSGPERANRRVAIRRITPLIDPDAVTQR